MRRLLDSLDMPTIFAVLCLCGVGLVAIASATLKQPGREDLWKMQLAWLAIGLAGAAVVVLVDYHVWAGVGLVLHGVVIGLLVTVLFFGRSIGGNKSWLGVRPLRPPPSGIAEWEHWLVVAACPGPRH